MPDPSQRRAARVVGITYLCALVPAVFAEFYVRGQLIAPDAPRTALNIITHESLFRLGIASNLIVFALDVALITSLYVVLERVDRSLALMAMAWGLIETAILVVTTLNDLDVLRILSGADYLKTFDPSRLEALARLSVGAHGAAYGVGLVLAGLRSTTFCYLWLRSRLVPRALALFGVVASVLMGVCSFCFIISPQLGKVIPVAIYGGPIFLFELTMGLWLVLKGLAANPRRADVLAEGPTRVS